MSNGMVRVSGLHLVPSGEKWNHETRFACPCEPNLGVEPDADGQYGLVVTHSKLRPKAA